MTEADKSETPQTQAADLTERVIDVLRTVYDPEIPVNVYDLGLIYAIDIQAGEGGKPNLGIDMTLTTANCPLADMIPGMVHGALASKIPDFGAIDVKLVWEPAWDPSRMSDEAKLELDMF